MPAAASSALAPLCRGMSTKALTLLAALCFAPGMPNATFLPSISMVTPSSFAAVNLYYPVRCENGDVSCIIPGVHKAVGNGIRADAKWSPFFRNGLSETYNSRLRSGIICLANVSMQTGCRRDVNNGTIFWRIALRVTHRTRMTGPSRLERTLTRK